MIIKKKVVPEGVEGPYNMDMLEDTYEYSQYLDKNGLVELTTQIKSLVDMLVPRVFFNESKEYLYSSAVTNAGVTIDLSTILGELYDGEHYYYECYLSVRDYDSGDHEFEIHSDLMNSTNNASQGQPIYIQGTDQTRHCQNSGTLYAQRYIYLRNVSNSDSRRVNLWWVKAVHKSRVTLLTSGE